LKQYWYFPNEVEDWPLNKAAATNTKALGEVPELSLKYSKGKETNIMFLSDVHIGSVSHNEELLDNTLGLIDDLNAYIVLVGDTFEAAFPSRHEHASLEESMTLDDQYWTAKKKFMPFRDRILISTRGNHDARVWKKTGFDMARRFAAELGCFYNANGGYFRINVGTQTYTVAIFHGFSAGANPYTELEKRLVTYDQADLLAMGNNHYLGYTARVKKRVVDGVESRIPIYLMRTGAFLSEPEYSREALYAPTFEGAPIVTFNGTKRVMKFDVEGESKFF
jgi:hypothetical protein